MESKTPQEIAAELQKSVEDARAELKQAQEELQGAKSDLESYKAKAEKVTELEEQLKSTIDQINALKTNNALGSKGDPEEVDFKSAIVDVLSKSDFVVGKTYETKATTANVITPITSGHNIGGDVFAGTRAAAFMPDFKIMTVPEGKETVVWVEGTYSSKVGYVNEGAAPAGEDTIEVTEQSRKLAKISAKIKVTAEMFEDKTYVASLLQSEMQKKVTAWLDRQLVSGVGSESDQSKIQGLISMATAFDATKAGVASSIDNPNLSGLISAIQAQGEVIDIASSADVDGFTINRVYLNPADFVEFQNIKGTDGHYLNPVQSDGTIILSGVTLVKSAKMAKGTLLAIEAGLPELHTKRNIEVKTGQEADDLSKDMYTIVAFFRGQSILRANDKAGVIYVADIAAALTAITKA